MLVMQPTSASPQVRRLVLVPTGPTPSRGDELVRRYRLARLRLAGREASTAARQGAVPSPHQWRT
jgi:hypothetical protein